METTKSPCCSSAERTPKKLPAESRLAEGAEPSALATDISAVQSGRGGEGEAERLCMRDVPCVVCMCVCLVCVCSVCGADLRESVCVRVRGGGKVHSCSFPTDEREREMAPSQAQWVWKKGDRSLSLSLPFSK